MSQSPFPLVWLQLQLLQSRSSIRAAASPCLLAWIDSMVTSVRGSASDSQPQTCAHTCTSRRFETFAEPKTISQYYGFVSNHAATPWPFPLPGNPLCLVVYFPSSPCTRSMHVVLAMLPCHFPGRLCLTLTTAKTCDTSVDHRSCLSMRGLQTSVRKADRCPRGLSVSADGSGAAYTRGNRQAHRHGSAREEIALNTSRW
ncbi:hypothetical protein BCV70DRAFT_63397 [Testicularia cyperi]|uniref:Uncharacterized protein n=1 Tax=Testicularia cyperi TaxID=1882483 RepID=A0A317XWR9_9BASI|nr:hypothetical protein BCV70DRAFT_63397 [Testicularia cyperi]